VPLLVSFSVFVCVRARVHVHFYDYMILSSCDHVCFHELLLLLLLFVVVFVVIVHIVVVVVVVCVCPCMSVHLACPSFHRSVHLSMPLSVSALFKQSDCQSV